MRLKPIIIRYWRAFDQMKKDLAPQDQEKYVYAYQHGVFHIQEMPSRWYVINRIKKKQIFLGVRWQPMLPLTEDELNLEG